VETKRKNISTTEYTAPKRVASYQLIHNFLFQVERKSMLFIIGGKVFCTDLNAETVDLAILGPRSQAPP
jgi:hypothetical protein